MPAFLTSRQLSVAFGVKPRTATQWIVRGCFPNAVMVQLGPRFDRPLPETRRRTNAGTWYVPLEDVEAWLEELYAGERMLSAKVREALRALAQPMPPARPETKVSRMSRSAEGVIYLAHPKSIHAPETPKPPQPIPTPKKPEE